MSEFPCGLADLVRDDLEEARRQQLACAWTCEVCGHLRLPFESAPHTDCDNAEARGSQYGPNVFARDGYRCCHCGSRDLEDLTIDHIFPVSRGGGDEPDNLQTLCQPCNSTKSNRVGA